jgi:hypothetical protein
MNVGKTIIDHPMLDGFNPTHKNGDDLGMVRLWHCLTTLTMNHSQP